MKGNKLRMNPQRTRALPETAVDSHMALLKSKKYCDVTFCVGPSKKEIKCHKIFLTARSVVFETMFCGTWNTSNIVNMPTTEPEDFQMFLEYMYCDKFTSSITAAMKLLQLGHQYQVDSLVKKCEELMSQDLELDDCIDIFKVARTYSLTKLMKKAGDIMARSFPRLSKDTNFRTMDEDILIYLLKRDDLPLAEIDIFTAVLRWARDNMGENPSYPEVLKNIIPVIRFPLMSSLEFASKVVPIQILPQKDVIDLFLYFNSDGTARQDAARSLKFSAVPRKGREQVMLQLYEAADQTSLTNSSYNLMDYYRLQNNLSAHEDILEITYQPGVNQGDPRVMKLLSVVLQGLDYKALQSLWNQSYSAASTHQVVVSVKAVGTGPSSSTATHPHNRVDFQTECVITKGKETEVTLTPSIEIRSNCIYQIAVKFQNVRVIQKSNSYGNGYGDEDQLKRIDHMTKTTLKSTLRETAAGGTFDVNMVTSATNTSNNLNFYQYPYRDNTSTWSLHAVRGLKFVWE